MTNLEQIKVLRDALEMLLKAHTKSAGMPLEIIRDESMFTSFMEDCDKRIALAVAAACNALAATEFTQVRRRAVAEIEYVADSLPGNDSLEFSVFEMQSMIFAYRETKRRLTMAENKLATPSSSFLAAHKIKKYQARAVRIAMEVLKRHAESDAESFKALKALEHNFKTTYD